MQRIKVLCIAASMAAVLGGTARAQSGAYFNAITNLNPLVYFPLNESAQPIGGAKNSGSLGTAGDAGYAGTISLGQQGAMSSLGDSSDTNNSVRGDGNTDEIVLPYHSFVSTVPLTMEGWFNTDSGFNAGEVLFSDGQVNGNRTGLWVYGGINGNDFNLRTYTGSGTTTGVNIDVTDINPGQWYHVAVTVGVNPASNSVSTGFIVNYYIDGTNAGSGICAFAPNVNAPLKIGNRSDEVGYNFAGEMDEVAFYPTALSSATVLAHYQAGTNNNTPGGTGAGSYYALVQASHPLLYYRLDEGALPTQPTATNYGSLADADNAFYGFGTVPAGVPGPAGAGFSSSNRACQFFNANGLGAVVDDPDQNGLVITGPITMVTWIQAGDQGGSFDSYMGRGDNSWRGDVDGGNIAHFADAADSGGDLNSATAIGDNKWHFLVSEWDGASNAFIYIDGVLNATQTGLSANTQSGNPGIDFIMGGVPDYSSRNLQGNLSQVAIFNYALSPAQIQGLYSAAELLPYFTINPPASTVIIQGSGGTITASATGNGLISYHWYTNGVPLSDNGTYSNTGNNTLIINNAQTNQSGNYTVVASNSFGMTTSSVDVVTVTPAPFIVAQPSPTNVTLYAGNHVVYSPGVVGSSLAYQWYNGTNAIAGATSSNFTATAQIGTNNYTLHVTNSFGVATSVVATVIGKTFVPDAHGFTLNFSAGPGSGAAYIGQGAYPDTDNATYTNDFWNAIPSGTTTQYITSIVNGAQDSSTNTTLSGFVLKWGFNNTPGTSEPQGTVGYLMQTEDGVNSGNPGIGTSSNPEGQFIITNLPPGAYSLYLYGANFDGDRGTAFTVNNPAIADNGITATTNSAVLGRGNASGAMGLAEGDNYVLYHNVIPDSTGTITGTYIPNPNPLTGSSGEAPFNGLQLALQIISIKYSSGTGSMTVNWSGGSLYSAPAVNGPWTFVATNGTPPLVVSPPLGSAHFYTVY